MIEFVIFIAFLMFITLLAFKVTKKIDSQNKEIIMHIDDNFKYLMMLDLANEDIELMDDTIDKIKQNMDIDAERNMSKDERLKAIDDILFKYYEGCMRGD